MCVCVFAGCDEVTTDHLQHFKSLTRMQTLIITGEQASLISGHSGLGSWIRELPDSLRRIGSWIRELPDSLRRIQNWPW